MITPIPITNVTVNLKTLYSTFFDTCYRFIGDDSIKVKDFHDESSTDTECIREIENSVFRTVSKECMEFCDSQGLTFILADCLIRAKELFSNILNISAELDYFRDDESENTEHVVIRVEVKSAQQTALEEYDNMVCWMNNKIAPSQGEYFTINVKRV